ncbi:MAG: DUF4301 family protein [Desulfobaccales bacterium]
MATFLKNLEYSAADLRQMLQPGITQTQVRQQIGCFFKPRSFIRLNRAGTLRDGIVQLGPPELNTYLLFQTQAAAADRFLEFVPAAGTASRLFQVLHQIYDAYGDNLEKLSQRATDGEATAREFLHFLEALRFFPFYSDLAAVMARDGLSLDAVLEQGQFRTVLGYGPSPPGFSQTCRG